MRWVVWVVVSMLVVAAPSWGKVVIEQPVHDFGTVEQGTRVTRQFVIRNKSRATLRLDAITASCGCTTAVPQGQTIPPGGRLPMTVSLDTAGLTGPTTKTVVLRTSDSKTPAVQVALRGTVLSDLVVKPDAIYLGRVYRDAPVRHELVVAVGRPGPGSFQVTSVETESNAVRAYLASDSKPGQQKIYVELGWDVTPGRFNDEIVIHTTSPRQPVLRVPVFGAVSG